VEGRQETGENYMTRNFVTFIPRQILLGRLSHRRMNWAGHVACIEEKRYACGILARRQDGNASFGRFRRRRGNNIKMDLMEFFSWINLAHKRVM
jgi:hypothetical protein